MRVGDVVMIGEQVGDPLSWRNRPWPLGAVGEVMYVYTGPYPYNVQFGLDVDVWDVFRRDELVRIGRL